MTESLAHFDEATKRIASGAQCLVAGDEAVLRRLPKGRWLGGTIPYFMADEGGVFSQDRVFVSELPDYCKVTSIRACRSTELPQVYNATPAHGFSFIVLPAMSSAHLAFATDAPRFDRFAERAVVGWVSGVKVEMIGRVKPRVFLGETGESFSDAAAVMHVAMPEGKVADIRILNIFEPSEGASIVFPETGFSVRQARVDGKTVSFAAYVSEQGLDTRLPLVADHGGAMINTSFQEVDPAQGTVKFYAPVFAGVEYRPAKRIDDYIACFEKRLPSDVGGDAIFSCNCILNYLYSKLEGRRTGPFVGPITFGEIAYQLLNQTLVYLVAMNASTAARSA